MDACGQLCPYMIKGGLIWMGQTNQAGIGNMSRMTCLMGVGMQACLGVGLSGCGLVWATLGIHAVPKINFSPVPHIMYGSWHFVPVTLNSCWSFVYDILLNLKTCPSLWPAENESCQSLMHCGGQ